jgi:hypothetical protein
MKYDTAGEMKNDDNDKASDLEIFQPKLSIHYTLPL